MAPSWAPNGNVVCAAPGEQQAPQLVRAGEWGALACWQDRRLGEWDVFVGRISNDVRGPVGVGPDERVGLQIQGPWPNPARERATVTFVLPREGTATVAILDVTGRRVREMIVTGAFGEHRSVAIDLSGLASGVYVVRLEGPAGGVGRRFAIVR